MLKDRIYSTTINPRSINLFRFEVNALVTRIISKFSFSRRAKLKQILQKDPIYVNVGSGGTGQSDWVNMDVGRAHKDQSIAHDIRCKLHFPDNTITCFFAEHVVEHLEFRRDVPLFFREVLRTLKLNGRIRIVVPDTERFLQAYVNNDRQMWADLGVDKLPDDMPTYMSMVNHIFHQDGEHYFGWDFQTFDSILKMVGFSEVIRSEFRKSEIDDLNIDLEVHRKYSLYLEAIK